MAAIAVSASTGVMNSLLSKLSILLSDKYKQLKGVRKDIEFFSRELANMSAALETLANVEKLDPQTKVWRDMVRDTAYDIEDCIDIFMHNLGKGGDKEGLLDKISAKIRKLRAHNRLADKIQELKARVVEQSESRDRYKIAEAAASPVVPPVDPRVQAMFEDAQRLVGIDGPRDEITRLLLEEGDNNFGKPKVLSIVGFGGLGKTTLANQVYTKIKNQFQCAAFVSVSRSPDMANILKQMLSGVGYRSMNMSDDVNKLITALTEHLADKRYLIVIDDIWRITDWNYIEISEDVLRKCRGVPLAITSIASLLATHGKDILKWEKIRHSMGSELETNPTLDWMRHVLSLSYNDLPHHLKTCLLYLGTYPEDYKIMKDDLVGQWIAEGFVPEKRGLDLEEVAEGYFNELINRNMVQPIAWSEIDEVKACQVHDLMLDLILLKCIEENFISTIDGLHSMTGTSQVRRISHHIHTRDMPPATERMNLSQVRSYMFYRAAKCTLVLSNFELLRVLDMEIGSYGGSASTCLDLSCISHLFLLRYLNVRGFVLKLPKKLGKLQHLMTLNMAFSRLGNSNLRKLYVDFSAPEQFWNDCFTRPHHLQVVCSEFVRIPQLPKWMAQADRLAYLERLVVEQLLNDGVQILAHLPCLASLHIQAKEVPGKTMVIHSNAFPVLKRVIFRCKLSYLTFEPGAMPLLKELYIDFGSGAPEAEHGISPVNGIEHLASLEKVSVQVQAKRGEGSKLESLCRNSIQRHQRYQSIKTNLDCEECDD
ncbi:unnamed protein product [Urochloa decumbens]|uniref:Uncharacterized protein n=1 Tax=Urochloa decumbens TaxID=240449 RepID=A0ABC9APQ9_9POAL